MNPYDGKAFLIDYTDATQPGAGTLWPVDNSLPPARIRGWSLNGRYALDPKNTGNSDDYVDGPWCGKSDVFEALGKRGQQEGTEAGTIPVWTHDDGTPWTAQECEACPLPGGPVHGGPNAGPANPPKYEQVGGEIVPVPTAGGAAPAPPTPAAPANPSLPAGAPEPAHVIDSLSLLARVRHRLIDGGVWAGHEVHAAIASLEALIRKL